MRKLIIRLFALEYIASVNGIVLNWTRASNVIFPLMCINGAYIVLTDSFPFDTPVGIVLFSILVIALFFGFGYFNIKPLKEDEIDDPEMAYFLGEENLSPEKWALILEYMDVLVFQKRWHNFWIFAINPIFFIATILILLI